MPNPRGQLASGERVVLDLRPHGRALARPLLLAPVVVGIAAFLAALVPGWHNQAYVRLGIAIVAVVVVVRWSLLPYLVWRGLGYVITTQRITVVEGVLRRRRHDLPLDRIHDVSSDRTMLERLLRSGTLVVETGGEHGQVVLVDVPRVEQVQETLLGLVAGH